MVTISPARPCARARARDRAADQAEADQRDALEQRRRRSLGLRHEVAQRRRRPVDWPPRCRWSCAAHAAGRNCSAPAAPGRVWSGTHRRRPRSCPSSVGKWISTKFADARRHLQAELGRSPRSASRATCSVWALRHLRHARCPRSRRPRPACAGVETLNGPRIRLTASTMLAGPNIQPIRSAARPWILEKVCVITVFSVVATSSMPSLVIVARRRSRHRRRRAPAATCARQAGAQPLDLVERHVGAGRVVRVGEPHQLGAAASPRARIASTSAVKLVSARDHVAWRRSPWWRSGRPESRGWWRSPRRRGSR